MNVLSLYDQTLQQLSSILSEDGKCIYASASYNFQTAVFGRDSVEIGEDLMRTMPEIARRAIYSLAALQGLEHNEISEEEPGKIPHEYRHAIMGGKEISEDSKNILRILAERWGGNENEVIYYGSIDSTPLFVRLVCNYCKMYGNKILHNPILLRNGQTVSLEWCLLEAMTYLEQSVTSSSLGLLEFKTTNRYGHIFQTWKDSQMSFVHTDGMLANVNAPIAAIDVQGMAYDAFVLASELFTTQKKKIYLWKKLASQIQSQVLLLFWNEQQHYFAMGLDRDTDGKVRQIATESSDAAILLETKIFDSLSVEHRNKYVAAIITHICSDQFLTDVGIRCRSVNRSNLVDFADYHGSFAVWPKQTNDVVYGLIKQGYYRLAEQLSYRIINGVFVNGKPMELFYVALDGRVNYFPTTDANGKEQMYTNLMGEEYQGWTMSAVINCFERIRDLAERSIPDDFISKTQSDILSSMQQFNMTTLEENKQQFTQPEFTLNITEGNRRRDEFLRKQGLL